MKHSGVCVILICATCLVTLHPASAVTIDWVPVGNPGNPGHPTFVGLGAVAYNYNIDKYDVTVGQYTEFLNAVAKTDPYGLYNGAMVADLKIAGISQSGSSGSFTYSVIGSSANLPITYVDWGDAARFANWLQNGQPMGAEGPGTTETGAYTLNGAMSDLALYAIPRNPGATVFIPSLDEYFKAAYYNPGTSSYYLYPFSSNTMPTPAMPGSTPNTGNFYDDTTGYAVTGSTTLSSSQNYLTAVGAYTASASPYGVYDMGGDVWQWLEFSTEPLGRPYRGVFGGSWYSELDASPNLRIRPPSFGGPDIGFRVASVPEPSTAVLAALAFAGLAGWGWRRRR